MTKNSREAAHQCRVVHKTSDLRKVEDWIWQTEFSRIKETEFLQVLWTADLRFTNGSKALLKRLGVSTGFPVFLFVPGPAGGFHCLH
jgi:hypothetical protein